MGRLSATVKEFPRGQSVCWRAYPSVRPMPLLVARLGSDWVSLDPESGFPGSISRHCRTRSQSPPMRPSLRVPPSRPPAGRQGPPAESLPIGTQRAGWRFALSAVNLPASLRAGHVLIAGTANNRACRIRFDAMVVLAERIVSNQLARPLFHSLVRGQRPTVAPAVKRVSSKTAPSRGGYPNLAENEPCIPSTVQPHRL